MIEREISEIKPDNSLSKENNSKNKLTTGSFDTKDIIGIINDKSSLNKEDNLTDKNDENINDETQPCSLENSEKKTTKQNLDNSEFEFMVTKKLIDFQEDNKIVSENINPKKNFIDGKWSTIMYILPLMIMILVVILHPQLKIKVKNDLNRHHSCPKLNNNSSNDSFMDTLNIQSKSYFNTMKKFINSSEIFETILTNQKLLHKLLEGKEIINYINTDHFDDYKKTVKTSRLFSGSLFDLSQKYDKETLETYNDLIMEKFDSNDFRRTSKMLKELKKPLSSFSKQLEKVDLIRNKLLNQFKTKIVFDDMLKIHLNEGYILLGLFLFLGLYITVFLNKFDFIKGIIGVLIVSLVLILMVYNNYSKISVKIDVINEKINYMEDNLQIIKEIHRNTNCEHTLYLDLTNQFTNILDENNEKMKKIITDIVGEVKKYTELENDEATKFAETEEMNFDLYIPKDLISDGLNQTVNDVKNSLKEIRLDTCKYFSNLHLFSESFMSNIDLIKTDIINNNGFKFQQFIKFVISFFKKKNSFSKKLVETINENVGKIEEVGYDIKNEEKSKNDKNDLNIKVINGASAAMGSLGAYSGATSLIVGAGALPVLGIASGAVLGYVLSEKYFTQKIKQQMKQLKKKFKEFRKFLKKKKNNLEENMKKITIIKENLSQMIRLSENLYDNLMEKFGNDEVKLTQFLMNENKDYFNSLLDLIKNKIFSTWKLSKEFNLDQFSLK